MPARNGEHNGSAALELDRAIHEAAHLAILAVLCSFESTDCLFLFR